MSLSDRRNLILAYLTNNGSATVHCLARELYASEATIRRDLTRLEAEGKIKRTFGGAALAETLNREVPLSIREGENPQAKAAIARLASHLIADGNTIFLDASSTVAHLVRYLKDFQELTVVTNSPKTSLSLSTLRVTNLCTGGMLLPNSVAYVGEVTCALFRRFNPDIVFLSCRGVSTSGQLCDSSLEEAHVREAMLSCTGKKVFLCDTTKLGKLYRYNFSSLDAMDYVFCENGPLPEPYLGLCRASRSPAALLGGSGSHTPL